MSDIKEYTFKELSLHEQKTALEFIEYLENIGCTFRIDNPTFDDLFFLKKIVEIRTKEIQSKL